MRLHSRVAAVVGAVVVAAIGVTVVLPRPTIAGLLGLVVISVCLTALYRVTVSESFTPVAVTFWAFVAVWVGFAPLLQIKAGRLPWPDLPLHQFYVTAQVILLCAVVAWWFGYTRAPRPAPPRTTPRFAVTIEKAIVVTGIATVMAIACLPQTGGLAVRFTTRDDLQAAIREAGLTGGRDLALLGLLSTLPAAASLAALLLCLLCWRNRNYAGPRARWMLLVTTGVAGALNVIYNNPLTANRFAAFSVLLAAGVALVRFDRRRWQIAFSVGMLLGLAVLYPLANLFRNDRSRGSLRVGLDAYYTWDFDGFQQTVNGVYYAHVHGHTWGHHIVSALLFWVPRSIWEGKAVGAGNVVAASRGYEFQNLALPFWAEVYIEFTLVGVVVLFYFYGRLARLLDRAISAVPAELGTALAVLFAACQIGLVRGPLGAQIPFAGTAMVVLFAGVVGWRGTAWHLTRLPEPREHPQSLPAHRQQTPVESPA
ncbi:oligosaccharide repeat unit polymerase [Micromonospora sp. CPCC 205371]|nr:oligosaccharide repeat unit polymerase [Micromonospora sp. CPCC 205371]